MLRALSFAAGRPGTAESNTHQHSRPIIVLHWGTVAVIVASVAAIYLRELFEDKAVRQAFLEIHRQTGLVILAGVALRLLVRYWYGFADHAASMPPLLRLAAKASHWTLYAMLLVLPLLGWVATSAHGVDLRFLTFARLPSLTGEDADLADEFSDYHKWAAWALGALVLVHILAALWHHFVRRDNVLTAMLPRRHPPGA